MNSTQTSLFGLYISCWSLSNLGHNHKKALKCYLKRIVPVEENGQPAAMAGLSHQLIEGITLFFHWTSIVGHLVMRHVLMGEVSVMSCVSGCSSNTAVHSW